MHIVILAREVPPVGGGAGAVAIEHAQGLATRGHRVELITTSMPVSTDESSRSIAGECGMRVHVIPVRRKALHTTTYLEMLRFVVGATRLLRQLVRTEQIDAIHAHAVLPDAVPALFVTRTIRVTATAHGSDVPGFNRQRFRFAHVVLRPLWRATSRRIDVISAPSNFLVELLRSRRQPETVVRLPYGIRLRQSFASDARRNKTLLVAARLDPRKRVNLVLEALAGIPQPVTLHVLGDGSERHLMESLAARICPQHDVKFHGWIRNQSPDWYRLMSEASISVSMSSVENSPVALLEAQLAEHVVVVSDIPGHRTVVHPRGRFIKGNSASLREELKILLNCDESELADERAVGRNFVLTEFDWDLVLSQYEALHHSQQITR